jgi:hypothetical protein
VPYQAQVLFGIAAAVAAYLVFLAWGFDYFLPAGLLVANALESARRLVQHHGAQPARA